MDICMLWHFGAGSCGSIKWPGADFLAPLHHSVKIQLPCVLGGGNMGTLQGAVQGLAGQWRVIIDWGN